MAVPSMPPIMDRNIAKMTFKNDDVANALDVDVRPANVPNDMTKIAISTSGQNRPFVTVDAYVTRLTGVVKLAIGYAIKINPASASRL
jgi:hypothetical protein